MIVIMYIRSVIIGRETNKTVKNNKMENNKIIAEFMGLQSTNKCVISETGEYYDYHSHPKFSCIKEQEIQIESENGFGLVEQDFLFIEDLKFHSNWNWLMEVVERIESIDFIVDIDGVSCYVYSNDDNSLNVTRVNKTKMQAVYNACVEFIKWYNEQKEV